MLRNEKAFNTTTTETVICCKAGEGIIASDL